MLTQQSPLPEEYQVKHDGRHGQGETEHQRRLRGYTVGRSAVPSIPSIPISIEVMGRGKGEVVGVVTPLGVDGIDTLRGSGVVAASARLYPWAGGVDRCRHQNGPVVLLHLVAPSPAGVPR